jgi:hypothetical protein
MRQWQMIAFAVAGLALFLLMNLGSALALSDIAARPIVALARDGGAVRVAVQTPGQPAAPGEARPLGGIGILFGSRFGYALPDGSTVTCTIRFRSLGCSGGWTAERSP